MIPSLRLPPVRSANLRPQPGRSSRGPAPPVPKPKRRHRRHRHSPRFPGKDGPVTGGIWELELILGRQRVERDRFADTGIGGGSHPVSDAVDFYRDIRFVWDTLYPIRAQLAELYGPDGLYRHGRGFTQPTIHDRFRERVHVRYQGSMAELDRLLNVVEAVAPAEPVEPGRSPRGPAPMLKQVEPVKLHGPMHGWRTLMEFFGRELPRSAVHVHGVSRRLPHTIHRRH